MGGKRCLLMNLGFLLKIHWSQESVRLPKSEFRGHIPTCSLWGFEELQLLKANPFSKWKSIDQNCMCILNVQINFKSFKTRYRVWVWVLFYCLGFFLKRCLNDSTNGLALVCGQVNPPYSFSAVFQGLAIFLLLPLGNQKRGRWKSWTSSRVFYFQN